MSEYLPGPLIASMVIWKSYTNKLNVNSSLVDKTHINFYNTHFVTKSKFVWLRLYAYHLWKSNDKI